MESNINSVKKQYTFNDITNCIVSFFPPFKSANDLAYKIKNIFRTYKEFEKSIKDNEFYFKRKFSPKTEYGKKFLLAYANKKGVFEKKINSNFDTNKYSNILGYILLRAYLKLNQIEEEYYDNLDIDDFNSFCQIFFNGDKTIYKTISYSSSNVSEIIQ